MKFGLGSSTEKNGIPRIESVSPAAAIPGGEVEIRGTGFAGRSNLRPVVRFGEAEAALSLASSDRLVVRVPEGAGGGVVRVATAELESHPFPVLSACRLPTTCIQLRALRWIPTEISS